MIFRGSEHIVAGLGTFGIFPILNVKRVASVVDILVYCIWLCVPIPVFAFRVLSPVAEVILYILSVLSGVFVFDHLYPDSPHPIVLTITYGALLGTIIFNSA